MNATVAQIIAITPTPTPMPAFAPVLRPVEEDAGDRVCCAGVDAAGAGAVVEDEEEVEVCAASFGTELVCAACTLTDIVDEAPGIV